MVHGAVPLVEAYLAARMLEDELAAESVPVIRSALRLWFRFMHGVEPNAWTRDDVLMWLAQPSVRSKNTRKSRLTKLRPFVHWLILNGHMEVDVTLGLRVRGIPKGAPRDLAQEEMARLLAVLPDERAVLIVVLMAQLGLRCSDLSRVLVTDIDDRHQGLHVRAKNGRGDVTHWEYVPTEAWDLLRGWVDKHHWTSGPLIRSYLQPTALQGHTISKLVGRWMRDAQLKTLPHDGVSAHALRHTCAEHMLARGAELREVQHALGHRSIKSTEIYARRRPQGVSEAMEGRRYLERGARCG